MVGNAEVPIAAVAQAILTAAALGAAWR